MQMVNGNAPIDPSTVRPFAKLRAHSSGRTVIAQGERAGVKRELDETLLERLVALNAERAEEEKRGIVRWLRPEYQNPQAAQAGAIQTVTAQAEMDVDAESDADTASPVVTAKIPWPKGDIEQVKAVADILSASKSPLDIESLAAHFSGKGTWKKRLPSILEMLVVVGKVRADDGKFGVV
jgi:hypothetical protein